MANTYSHEARPFYGKIGEAFIRLGRCSVENFTEGFLSAVYYGKKKELPPISDPLLLESAVLIAKKIRKGEVSSVSVVKAYMERINEINPTINAVVDSRYSDALNEAAKADEMVRSSKKTEEELEREFPLLGVPFSSKEACLVEGLSSTCGLVCRKGLRAKEDCDAVKLLKEAGAISLVVTNTSEICMWWETYNKLHGLTNNPYDTTRTVGGSSGGEAALIASAGSLVGLGTDMGGSIRLPSFFAGIFGHKPSAGLVPCNGLFPPVKNDVSPYVAVGPMARYAQDLRLLTSVLVGKEATSRLRLETRVPLQSIKVYYMLDDGGQPARTPVHREIRADMLKALSWLRQTGALVEEVKLHNLKYGFMIWCSFLSRIKDQTISDIMSGGIKERVTLLTEMPKWFSGKSDYTFPIILNACAQDYLSPLLKKPLDKFYERGLNLKKEFDDLLKGDSVFICPTFPTPAQHHGQMLITPMNVGYSIVFNTLGMPVTQCPLGLASSGLPTGMQIVSAHGNDRLTLSVAEHLEQNFCWIRPS